MVRQREPLPSRVPDTPDLTAGYRDALDRGLQALAMTLSPAAREAIDGHARLLLAWTTAINLTAIRDPEAVATGHVIDSLAGARVVERHGVDRVLDLGSGGGYPGLPLAAALPGIAVTLVEPIGKKARFLETVVGATGLAQRVTVRQARAEALAAAPEHRGRWPLVTARAVASLPELVELAFPLLARGGALLAWKRADLDVELAAGRRAALALGGGRLTVVDPGVPELAGHRLVVAVRTGRVPDGYPRDPGARRRRPS